MLACACVCVQSELADRRVARVEWEPRRRRAGGGALELEPGGGARLGARTRPQVRGVSCALCYCPRAQLLYDACLVSLRLTPHFLRH